MNEYTNAPGGLMSREAQHNPGLAVVIGIASGFFLIAAVVIMEAIRHGF
jgi:hypothetical protein